MKVKWLGHASFLLTASDGTAVITDPYRPDDRLTYAPISQSADIVTISHGHGDHANVAAVKDNPVVVDATGTTTAKGVDISGVATFHDSDKGAQRGENTIFTITLDGLRVVHLGDLGHGLDADQMREIGEVDILLAPVGGYFTIDGPTASRLADALKPTVVIPMHFRNAKCAFPIADEQPFLQERTNIRRVEGSEAEFTREALPKATETVVLEPAL